MNICHSNRLRGLGLAALTAAAILVAAPAQSQDFLNAQDTMSCICWEDELAQVDAELNGPEVGAVRDEFNRVDQLLRQAHASLDTSDMAEMESVQRISERRTQLKQQLDQTQFPLLRRKVALTTQYNNTCAGRKMLVMNVEAAHNNPQCPATP